MKKNEQHLFEVKRILKELKEKKRSLDYQMLILENEQRTTEDWIRMKNRAHLMEVGLIKKSTTHH